jgi:glycosyltransferase involved in cell wall biosynthesis
MKVTVSVHGRYHAFELAKGLYERGALAELITTYPSFFVRGIVGADALVKSSEVLELQRRFHDRFGFGEKPDLNIATKFAKFAAGNLPDNSDLLVGWSSATLEAIAPAKARGMKVVIERGSTHIGHQTEVLVEAYESCGLEFHETAPEIIAREEEEYAAADFVSLPSNDAAQSFVKRGFDKNKLLVNSLGVDLEMFSAPETLSKRIIPRIIFAGSVGVRKGVPWLLRAFRKISTPAELHLFGQIEPAFQEMLETLLGDDVIIHGPVSVERLAAEYRKSDIFCLPSVEEGFGMVVPQAMASGLPVVITSTVGACDLISDGQEGLIVPPMNEDALAEALTKLIEDQALRHQFSGAAEKRVKNGCAWDDYVSRMIPLYEQCLS